MPCYASHLMRTPSKNKQWNRLSSHGAPESKVIMSLIVYRLALDCFALWSLLFLIEVSQRGDFILFAVQMYGCSLERSTPPLDNNKVTKKDGCFCENMGQKFGL